MILKLMSDEPLPDDDTTKMCQVVSSVIEVRYFKIGTGEKVVGVGYKEPVRGLDSEEFILQGNAYLMNDAGKTIQAFSC